MNYCALILAGGCWAIGELATAATLEQQATAIADRLEGVMDTSAQARANPNFSHVRMVTCRVSLSRAGDLPASTILMYQEQALSTKLGQPYRQRFLQIGPSPYSQSVRSLAFRPSNPNQWINFCNRPTRDRILSQRDLGTPICSVFLRQVGPDYVGNTPIDGCPAQVRGAVRITNHIVLHQTGMTTWDRGYDATGKQVWGAQTEAYQFLRQPSPALNP